MSTEAASRRLFTIEEANQRLPLIRAIVQDIVDLYREVKERRERLAGVRHRRGENTPGPMYAEELDQVEEELHRDEERLAGFIQELLDLGVEFKDPELGLVDFPARMDDRVVFLCWKLGEPDVRFWHELDAGFSGRQSLCEGSIVGEDARDGDQAADGNC